MTPLLLALLLAQSPLFDGKTLNGWYWSKDPNTPAPSWTVRNGNLVCTPKQGKAVYLISKEQFEDFDLSWEWRAEVGANSGVKYRFQALNEGGSRLEPTGLEYQMTDDLANSDALSTPRHSSGALYDYMAPAKRQPAKPGVWHTSRIVAKGLHIEHWLDGERVINIDLDTPAAEATFNESKRNSRHMLRKQERRLSSIALQIHDGEVEFRKIVITAIK